jgi:hypothetical protein
VWLVVGSWLVARHSLPRLLAAYDPFKCICSVYIHTRSVLTTNGSYLPFSIIDTSLHLHLFLPLFFGIARDTSHPPHAVIKASILTAKLSRPASVNSRRPHKPSS